MPPAIVRPIRRNLRLSRVVPCALVCAACGGGSGSTTGPSAAVPYSAPAQGTRLIYEVSTTDLAAHLVGGQYVVSVPTVNADGSFIETTVSSVASQVVDGTTYNATNYSESRDAQGRLLSRTYLPPEGSATCEFAPPEAVIPFPLSVGQTWSGTWTATCSDGTVQTYALTAARVVDQETITVPAGSFDTLLVQYTIRLSSTTTPLVDTISFSVWIDVATAREVQLRKTYVYSGGTPSPGSADAVLVQLVSAAP